ncbi:MAG: hypothetical protein V1926_06305 [Candidatus Peregrinibacteria bacterium]
MAAREYTGSRLTATGALMVNDLQEGIDFRNNDTVGNVWNSVRNIAVATLHGIQGIIPSIANAFNGQQFHVRRRQSTWDGTGASVRKIVDTKGILGKASAVLAEATDGPVDDLISATTGGSQWIVEPTRSRMNMTLAL